MTLPWQVRPSRRTVALSAALTVAAGLSLASGCNNETKPPAPVAAKGPTTAAVPDGPPFFRDATADSGVTFTYQNGEKTGHLAIVESLGGGLAMIDYDGDGLLDLYFPGGGFYDKDRETYEQEVKAHKDHPKAPAPVPPGIHGHPGKLFKNLGNFKFRDVSKEAGLDFAPAFYTHGGAVADYDRDGWSDLLVTGYGRLLLLHNESDGKGGRRFVDTTVKAGLGDTSWSSSAGWGDFDGDGFPDLYVCHYADWSFANNPTCTYDGKTPDVCPPKSFSGLPHLVYHNQSNGTFVDITASAGLKPGGKEASKGLGVLIADFNGDRKPDIYVANDTVDNFLYMNRSEKGKIRFDEIGLQAGVARDDHGSPNGSMGLAVGDPVGTGRPSIWVTNYENEMHALYLNECQGKGEYFRFSTQITGIAAIGQAFVGWGTTFMDVDHHGWLDLFVVNGHAIRYPQGKSKRAQRPVFLRNLGPTTGAVKAVRYGDWSTRGGTYFASEHVGRGAAFGDLDNDGRIDVVVCHQNEPVALLRNEADVGQNHWLGIELGSKDHRDRVGAKLTLEVGERKLYRFAYGGGSYASANDQRQTFGLGTAAKVGTLTVQWPSGVDQTFEALAIDRYWRLVEGEKPVPMGTAGPR